LVTTVSRLTWERRSGVAPLPKFQDFPAFPVGAADLALVSVVRAILATLRNPLSFFLVKETDQIDPPTRKLIAREGVALASEALSYQFDQVGLDDGHAM
jgi:hypothetical protein